MFLLKFLRYWMLRPLVGMHRKDDRFRAYAFKDGMLAAIADANIQDKEQEQKFIDIAELVYNSTLESDKKYWDNVLAGNERYL